MAVDAPFLSSMLPDENAIADTKKLGVQRTRKITL